MVSVHSGLFERQFVGELERILTEGDRSENNFFQIFGKYVNEWVWRRDFIDLQ